MAVNRYFAGYPRPRLRPWPLAFAVLWVVLAHPATTDLAVAMFAPVEKVPHGVVRLAAVPPEAGLDQLEPGPRTPTFDSCRERGAAARPVSIRGWRYHTYWGWSHCRGRYPRRVCTVERFRFDP